MSVISVSYYLDSLGFFNQLFMFALFYVHLTFWHRIAYVPETT